MSNNTKEDISILVEEDKPFANGDNSESKMSKREIESYEEKEKKQKLWLKSGGFYLLIGCLLALLLLFVIDTTLINTGLKSSDLLSSIFELLKYIVSMLLGYYFTTKSQEMK